MIYESQYQQPAVNVFPNGNGMGGSGDGAFGGGLFWIIVLFFFAIFAGWGNNGNGVGAGGQNYVQQGFDQAALVNGINGLQNSQNALAMSMQNCCCENRAATADLKYTIATEACADRAAVTSALQDVTMQNNANTQRILDMMCQDKIDAKNERIQELQNQLYMAQLAASQNVQTATILNDNLAQTQALEQYLAPSARPAYIVQNPNCCQQNYGSCCR